MANINQGNGTEIFSALDEENVEAASALAYIADVFESDPEGAFAKTLGHWSQWLGDEGYIADSVEQVIRKVMAEQLDSTNQSLLLEKILPDISVNEAVSRINSHAPGLVDALLGHVTHGANLHAALLGVSGGKGKNSLNVSKPTSLDKVAKHLKIELACGEIESITEAKGKTSNEALNVNESPLRKEAVNFNQSVKATNRDKLVEEFAAATITRDAPKDKIRDEANNALENNISREPGKEIVFAILFDNVRILAEKYPQLAEPLREIEQRLEGVIKIEEDKGKERILNTVKKEGRSLIDKSLADGLLIDIRELKDIREEFVKVLENLEKELDKITDELIINTKEKLDQVIIEREEILNRIDKDAERAENRSELNEPGRGGIEDSERIISRLDDGGEPNKGGEQNETLSLALQGVSDLKKRLSTEDSVQRQAEIAKVRFIENTIEELREERQQRKAIIENIETAIKTDPRGVAELVMKNRDEIPFEIATLREGIFIRKENKERIQRIEDETTTERNKIWMEKRREQREQDLRALEEAIRNHPEEALKALIVERVENPIPDTRDQQILDREEDRVAEREVDKFIDDIRSIRQQKREQEEMILKDIEKAIKTDPRGVAELVMNNKDEIPLVIDDLRKGIFTRKENKERIQRIEDEITMERNKIWMEKRREQREQDLLALEEAIRNHPEEALKALIVERVENPIPDTRDQQILDREEDRVAEREVDKFIDDIRSIRQQKREQEEMILKDIEKAIKTDPRGVAELVMNNKDEIPLVIDDLRKGIFTRKENKERIQRIEDEISTERNKIWMEKRREQREQDLLALEEAIRNHPEEALKALIVERRDERRVGLIIDRETRIQGLIDQKENRLVEREVDRFIARAVEDLRTAQENGSADRMLERVAYGLDEKISEVIKKLQLNDDTFPKDANIELRLREKIANKINEQNEDAESVTLGITEEINRQAAPPLSEQVRDPFDPYTPGERLLFRAITHPAQLDRQLENMVSSLIQLEKNYYTMIDNTAQDNAVFQQSKNDTDQKNFDKALSDRENKQQERIDRQIDQLMNFNYDAQQALKIDKTQFRERNYFNLKQDMEAQARFAESLIDPTMEYIENGVYYYNKVNLEQSRSSKFNI